MFDFSYSAHKGVIVYVKVWDGVIRKGDALSFIQTKEDCTVLETGIFAPESVAKDTLSAGEIGYIITGLKRSRIATVGDTLTRTRAPLPPLAGYKKPQPVVWASVYTESQDDFHALLQALSRLQLEDPRVFLRGRNIRHHGARIQMRVFGDAPRGNHHGTTKTRIQSLARCRDSFHYVPSHPKDGEEKVIYSPPLFPDHGTYEKAYEPWIALRIILPQTYTGSVIRILHAHEAIVGATETWGVGRISLSAEMPLRELMRNFLTN